MEIFGRKVEIVEDNSGSFKKCALSDFCYPYDYPYPCMDANGKLNRRFELVK